MEASKRQKLEPRWYMCNKYESGPNCTIGQKRFYMGYLYIFFSQWMTREIGLKPRILQAKQRGSKSKARAERVVKLYTN